MSYFYKGISYIDLYEKDEKKKTIGFVKITVKQEHCTLHIQIKGLPSTDTLQCSIKDLESKKEIDSFSLINGQGNYEKTFWEEKVGSEEISFHDMSGLFFLLSNHRYGIASWKEIEYRKSIPASESVLPSEPVLSSEPTPEPESEAEEITEEKTEEKIIAVEERKAEETSKVATDKWKQLCNMFPQIHPFAQEEMGEYISIVPRDFVVLQSKYQGLVNNSFLLHGYYNYHHIILGKKQTDGDINYYIGVPGNYYSREKAVAVMFGFEGFESVAALSPNRTEGIAQGSFGYYLCPVEI